MGGQFAMAIFAAGLDDAIGLIFVLIAIIGWFVNLLSGKQDKPVPKARPVARPRDESLQKEIDLFMQEVAPRRDNQSADRRAQAERRPQNDSQRAGQTSTSSKKRRKQQAQVSSPVAAQPAATPVANRPALGGSSLSTIRPSVGSAPVGSGLSTHHLETLTSTFQTNVESSVAAHLGTAMTSATPSAHNQQSTRENAAARVGQLLRQPGSISQAILINAILSPPVSRGGRSERSL